MVFPAVHPSATPNNLVSKSPFAGNASAIQEVILDGVSYAFIENAGAVGGGSATKKWRVGSIIPDWRARLFAVGIAPDAQRLRILGKDGIWVRPDEKAAPLALMCAGLGAAWPGMGRELYDSFPAARKAMDEIASVADWDVLSLMDENDLEKIANIRWQIPYLFLLEYAQWAVFSSLGLKASIFCGHSLGELIALCLAGIYSVDAAWYLLDNRATHIADLEKKTRHDTDMLVVHGDEKMVSDVCSKWPEIFISNYNTPMQFLLSGPKDTLKDARKYLRRQHVPAMLLNMGFAFHHPNMRILRNLALRRLKALEMHSPQSPVLSGVAVDIYPAVQEDICKLIADLDENTVRWVECVRLMRRRYDVNVFLELGPQDTLCGLVEQISASSICIPADRKGLETESMRRACAQLYSLGQLKMPLAGISQLHASGFPGDMAPSASKPIQHSAVRRNAASFLPAHGKAGQLVRLLARETGLPEETIGLDMDLRYDLSMRSSSFPGLLQKAEDLFGVSVNFEDLLHVSTVGDLARLFSGDNISEISPLKSLERASINLSQDMPPARRASQYYRLYPDFHIRPGKYPIIPLDLAYPNKFLRKNQVMALCAPGPLLDEAILWGIAAFGVNFVIPEPLAKISASLLRHGASSVRKLATDLQQDWSHYLDAAKDELGSLDGVLFTLKADDLVSSGESALSALVKAKELGARFFVAVLEVAQNDLVDAKRLRLCLDYFNSFSERLLAGGKVKDFEIRAILRLGEISGKGAREELGDLLACELVCNSSGGAVWASTENAIKVMGILGMDTSLFCKIPDKIYIERDDAFSHVRPAGKFCAPHEAGIFNGEYQFSNLIGGNWQDFQDFRRTIVLSHGNMLEAMLDGARSAVPWLDPYGIADVHFLGRLELPPAVTRECGLSARVGNWLSYDGVMTRFCQVKLEARELDRNGRRRCQYTALAAGSVLMSSCNPPAVSLWDTTVWQGESLITPLAEAFLAQHYNCQPKRAAPRMIKAFYQLRGFSSAQKHGLPGYIAEISLPPERFARTAKSRYKLLPLLDSVIQAGNLIISLRECENAQQDSVTLSGAWQVTAAGYIRFGKCVSDTPDYKLQIVPGWRDERMTRFDAQVLDRSGKLVLTVNQLEFERG